MLEGEPGIGKSTLWLAAVAAARERGFLVLASRPAEAERGLAHVVLGDLFEAVLEDVLPALTGPRRRALEAALLTDQAPEHPVDPRRCCRSRCRGPAGRPPKHEKREIVNAILYHVRAGGSWRRCRRTFRQETVYGQRRSQFAAP